MKDVNQIWIYSITIWGDIDDQPSIEKYFRVISKKYMYQLEECPSTGTRHFQCYINLKKKQYCHKVKQMFNSMGFSGACVKPASDEGKEILKSYCMKEDTRIEGPWADKPIYRGQDLIRELRPWQKKVVDMLQETPHPRDIWWYYDKKGGYGKTCLAKYMCYHYPKEVCYLTAGKGSDLLNLVYKFQGCKMYILDIARTIPKHLVDELYFAIESVKNGFFINTKYETGRAMFARPHVIVYANSKPKLGTLVGKVKIIEC